MPRRAVICDLFGTLVPSQNRAEYERLLTDMAGALDIALEVFEREWFATLRPRHDGTFPNVASNVQSICEAVGVTPSDDMIGAAVAARMDAQRIALRPRAGTIVTLHELRARKFRLGLVSNCAAEVPLLWSETAFAGLFDAALFSCVEHLLKPSRVIYESVCARLGTVPSECLYVGDGSSRELTGATEAGMTAVLLRVPDEEAEAHRVDADEWQGHVIASLDEVLDLGDTFRS